MLKHNVRHMRYSSVSTASSKNVTIYLRLTKYLVGSCNSSENLREYQLLEEQSSELIATSFHSDVSDNEIYHKA
jgi:hypothetical protein